MFVAMPAVSYARELWRYGEPDLAERALRMTPEQCAMVGARAGELALSRQAAELWPGGPRGYSAITMLAVIEHLDGVLRPPSRSRRLPEKSLPPELAVSEEGRWAAAQSVAAHAQRMAAEKPR